MMHTPVFACPLPGTRILAHFDGQVHEVAVLRQRGEWSLLGVAIRLKAFVVVEACDIVRAR